VYGYTKRLKHARRGLIENIVSFSRSAPDLLAPDRLLLSRTGPVQVRVRNTGGGVHLRPDVVPGRKSGRTEPVQIVERPSHTNDRLHGRLSGRLSGGETSR